MKTNQPFAGRKFHVMFALHLHQFLYHMIFPTVASTCTSHFSGVLLPFPKTEDILSYFEPNFCHYPFWKAALQHSPMIFTHIFEIQGNLPKMKPLESWKECVKSSVKPDWKVCRVHGGSLLCPIACTAIFVSLNNGSIVSFCCFTIILWLELWLKFKVCGREISRARQTFQPGPKTSSVELNVCVQVMVHIKLINNAVCLGQQEQF